MNNHKLDHNNSQITIQ